MTHILVVCQKQFLLEATVNGEHNDLKKQVFETAEKDEKMNKRQEFFQSAWSAI